MREQDVEVEKANRAGDAEKKGLLRWKSGCENKNACFYVCICRLQDEISQREEAETVVQSFRQVQYDSPSENKLLSHHKPYLVKVL